MAVAQLDRGRHVLDGVLRRDLEHAEPELRNLDVAQGKCRNLNARCHTHHLTIRQRAQSPDGLELFTRDRYGPSWCLTPQPSLKRSRPTCSTASFATCASTRSP